VPDSPTVTSPDELADQVSKLTAYERLYALYFLARCGPDHENGQALQRALAAVELLRSRLGM